MRRCVCAMLAAVLLLTGCSAKIIPNVSEPADSTVYTRESAGIRLEDDFYGYVNFDLLYGSDIPADMNEWSAGQFVEKQVDDILSHEIMTVVRGAVIPTAAMSRKYMTCMSSILIMKQETGSVLRRLKRALRLSKKRRLRSILSVPAL